MHKGLWITVLIVFGLFLGLFLFSQIPVAITQDEVSTAVSDAIAETNAPVDEMEVEQLVTQKAVKKLEARQKKRLKFLVSAYFIIWLIFSLYALHLAKMQNQLRKQLDQLHSDLQPKE
jgi:CcmD family protein